MSDNRHRATEPIDKSKVRSVYSGRHGCCCGCVGNHRYATAFRNEGSEHRGYTVRDDEVSDRSVSIIVNKMNRVIESGNPVPEDIDQRQDKEEYQVIEADAFGTPEKKIFSYSTENRLILAYYY